jgi:uncharacterized protein
MILKDARYWIDRLQLIPHPEGGYYRQTYRAVLTLEEAALPPEFGGSRSLATAIYFLLEGTDFSAFHRLRSDEMWHSYAGGPLVVHVIGEDGQHSEILLGSDAESGQVFQAVVKAGCWFGSRVRDPGAFALVGCTVSPGFEFADFELGKREQLMRQYPQHRELIEWLTRE